MPEETGFIPSVSAGWGINSTDDAAGGCFVDGVNFCPGLKSSTSQSWYVGIQWEDAFLEGNALGFAVGQPTFVTSLDTDSGVDDSVADGNYAFELFYNFQVTDNISLTPAVHYFSRPLGDGKLTGTGTETFNSFGGMVKTTFTF